MRRRTTDFFTVATGSNFLKKTEGAFFLLVVMCSLSGLKATAQGNLLITPRRVVFDGSQKTQELNLANSGQDTARYTISMVEIRMKEDGTFERVTEPDSGQAFASRYLRFFPRTVTLAPNEAQVIKVQLRNTAQLQPGEYRSHIYFRARPEDKALGEAPAPDADPDAISVKLVPVFGISIPAIIRIGTSDTKVSISDINVVADSIPLISMYLNRTGNMSSYGDVMVDYVSPDGKKTQVALSKGVAVYTPTAKRKIIIELEKDKKIDYTKGKLLVSYNEQPEAGGDKLADGELALGHP